MELRNSYETQWGMGWYKGDKREEEKIQLPESRKPELAWKILTLAAASFFLILVVLGGEP